MALPNITYIDQYITDGNKEVLSLKNFYETILVADKNNSDHAFRIPINDFFIKYQKEFEPLVQLYSVPQSSFYRPKSVSFDLYGTTELWLAIMRLNGMRNITEFHQPLIKMYNPNYVKELIDVYFKRNKVIC